MSGLPEILYKISYMGLPLLFAIVLHEYAHGWVAYRSGDPTAKLQGRLTMNPLAHIDLFGTILLPLICLALPGGFVLGWAKPVPVDPRLMRQPRRDMAVVAAAGPGMNLGLAAASGILLGLLFFVDSSLAANLPPQWGQARRTDLLGILLQPIATMAFYSVFINALLLAFNLIPIPPLDGGRILTCLLPIRQGILLSRLEPYGMLIVILLIILDPQIQVLQTIVGTVISLGAMFVNLVSGPILSTGLEGR